MTATTSIVVGTVAGNAAARNAAARDTAEAQAAAALTQSRLGCEYTVDVGYREYKCMTAQEYQAYKALPPSTVDIVMVTIFSALIIGLLLALCYLVYDAIFN